MRGTSFSDPTLKPDMIIMHALLYSYKFQLQARTCAAILMPVNECDLYGYADDNTLSKAAKDAASLKRALERDTANMLSWFTENYMSANPDKFQAIVLGMKNPETMNFAVGNVTINPSQSVKYWVLKSTQN